MMGMFYNTRFSFGMSGSRPSRVSDYIGAIQAASLRVTCPSRGFQVVVHYPVDPFRAVAYSLERAV